MSVHRLISQGRANRVFPPLYARHEAGLEPYNEPIVQDKKYLPDFEWGSREHALYLFFLCIYMKGGITSSAAIDGLTKFYNSCPEAFFPENLLNFEEYELEWAMEWLGRELQKHGLGVNVEESKLTWIFNSYKLAFYWDSDPRKIFAESDARAEEAWGSYEAAKKNYESTGEILMRKDSLSHAEFTRTPNGFYGFRHKMVSMIIYFYVHAGIIKSVPYPPPVDFHVLRVLLSTGVLKMRKNRRRQWGTRRWNYRERFLPAAREVTLRYIVKMKADPQRFAEALWLLSRNWCRHHPGNKSSVEKSNKARRRHITDLPPVWSEEATRRHDQMCGRCPVAALCEWNVPSSYYYVKGAMVLRWHRQLPPQLKLIDVPVTSISKSSQFRPQKKLPVLVEAHPSLFD